MIRSEGDWKADRLESAINWVVNEYDLDALFYDGGVARITLTEMPTKERFLEMIPDLDYEIRGGTLDEPLWAWMKHPWFSYLNMTEDECLAVFDNE